MREAGAGFRAYRGGMLADSAGEDQQIQAAERGCHGANCFSDLIAEHFDRHRRVGVGRARVEQCFHVGAESGDAEQAGFQIHEITESRGVVAFLLEQIQHHAGIEIARPRAHHEAAGRGEAHRRVERTAVAHRSHARAVAEMRD